MDVIKKIRCAIGWLTCLKNFIEGIIVRRLRRFSSATKFNVESVDLCVVAWSASLRRFKYVFLWRQGLTSRGGSCTRGTKSRECFIILRTIREDVEGMSSGG
jgi:hypothetical protein